MLLASKVMPRDNRAPAGRLRLTMVLARSVVVAGRVNSISAATPQAQLV
jgi:hypothetical protein